jgi:hypothetical protein
MSGAKRVLSGLAAIIVATITCIVFHRYLHVPDVLCNLVVAAVWLGAIWAGSSLGRSESERRQSVRTCFLSNNLLYNSESGVIRATGTSAQIDAMQDVLAHLRYGFDVVEPPRSNARQSMADLFDYVVRTKTFKVAPEADGYAPRLISWQGEVASTANPKRAPIPFSGRDGLAAALAKLRSD